ncbi:MAG: sigma 54-interacting transcriptional regulator [Lentihominibacter sp.]
MEIKNIYQTIVENQGDEILVSDNEGRVIFVNPASIEINDFDARNIIGKNVRELVREGYFTESSTLRVLKEKKTVSVLQILRNGRQIIATSIPVFDQNGDIDLVLTFSKDVEAIQGLLDTLEHQELEIANLKHELSRASDFKDFDPVSVNVLGTLEKLAHVDIPVMIQGEPGTGKQAAVRHIHFSGKRKAGTFTTINCRGMDDIQLEREIFGGGEEKGALDFAETGTLVLKNIDYMPYSIQNKLLDFIETGEFLRIGSCEPQRSGARIVATSSMDIHLKCENGQFNKALYYSLNTVPVRMLALRERHEDISNISRIYIEKCNIKYNSKKILSNNALGVLESHTWPGNLSELSQTIENAYIMSNRPVINRDIIYGIIYGSDSESNTSQVICKDIIPLKEARRQLEEQLVKNAIEVYKTTYKAAEILDVNQSTVVRLLQKHK